MNDIATTGWGFTNWAIVGIYLLLVSFGGVIFAKRNKTSHDYFLGGARVPAWVTALSIYSTMLSSISYLAIPASVYKNGMVVALSSLGTIVLAWFVCKYIIPVYRSVGTVTGYEYLERRFQSRGFRYVGALSFSLFHVARIGIVLYIPALALQLVFPEMNPILVLLATGVVCVGYSAVSGIEGIAWQDAIQAIILILGVLVMAGVAFSYAPEQGIMAALAENNFLLSSKNFEFSLTGDSVWAVIIANGIIGSVYSYIGSQDVVQRYSITKTDAEARKSVLYNMPLLLVSVCMFTLMGAALVIFFNYGHPLLENVSGNAIVPYFIFNYLPVGLSGFVIVAVLAATQSTVSSSINSLATCCANDLFAPDSKDDKLKLKIGKTASWVCGLLGCYIAYFLMQNGQGDLFKLFVALTGLIGGPIAAVFILAIFFDKVDGKAAYAALTVSILLSLYLGNPFGLDYTPIEVNAFLVSLVIIGSGVITGWVVSLVTPNQNASTLNNLTYKSVMANRAKAAK